ncbi:MAG TPA: MCE family protein, partial [Mycobacterium sp.]|nr:MCE family protein [Mycobacterium sp.]
MKFFEERNPILIGVVGVGVTAAVLVGVLNYDKVPLITGSKGYTAYFSEASGLRSGAAVQVSGQKVGKVDSVDLDGPRVLVTFHLDRTIRIGDRSEAAVKTKSLLGTKVLEVTPRGEGVQRDPIPVDRTRPAYELADALGDLTSTVSELNTDQVSESLATIADTFAQTPPSVRDAIAGVGRLSKTVNDRDTQLRNLLANANKATAVLAERSDQVVGLVVNTNAFLVELRGQRRALDQISYRISAATQQLKGFIGEHQATFQPAVEKLNGVLAIVDNRKERVQESIKRLNDYGMSLGESLSSGPFFKAYIVNLLPGQFLQPMVDAAFSDLGLDPSVLLPSERTDPPVGQRATPPLPIPYPRTGQGGEPNLTLPDAITGKPGDPRYPYREPPPAPPPGGPPPGPPAEAPPNLRSTPTSLPDPADGPSPGEVP